MKAFWYVISNVGTRLYFAYQEHPCCRFSCGRWRPEFVGRTGCDRVRARTQLRPFSGTGIQTFSPTFVHHERSTESPHFRCAFTPAEMSTFILLFILLEIFKFYICEMGVEIRTFSTYFICTESWTFTQYLSSNETINYVPPFCLHFEWTKTLYFIPSFGNAENWTESTKFCQHFL